MKTAKTQHAAEEKQRIVTELLRRAEEAHQQRRYQDETRLRDAASLVHGI